MSKMILAPLVLALITRGRDEIPVEVPEHELEILRVLHGDANVRVEGPTDDEIELDADAELEILRLQARYKRANAPDVVRMTFPTGARDLLRHGFERGTGPREVAPMAGVVDHRKAAKAAAKAEAEAAETATEAKPPRAK